MARTRRNRGARGAQPEPPRHRYPTPEEVDKLSDAWLLGIPSRCACGFEIDRKEHTRRERCRAVAVHFEEFGDGKMAHIQEARQRFADHPSFVHDDTVDGPRRGVR